MIRSHDIDGGSHAQQPKQQTNEAPAHKRAQFSAASLFLKSSPDSVLTPHHTTMRVSHPTYTENQTIARDYSTPVPLNRTSSVHQFIPQNNISQTGFVPASQIQIPPVPQVKMASDGVLVTNDDGMVKNFNIKGGDDKKYGVQCSLKNPQVSSLFITNSRGKPRAKFILTDDDVASMEKIHESLLPQLQEKFKDSVVDLRKPHLDKAMEIGFPMKSASKGNERGPKSVLVTHNGLTEQVDLVRINDLLRNSHPSQVDIDTNVWALQDKTSDSFKIGYYHTAKAFHF